MRESNREGRRQGKKRKHHNRVFCQRERKNKHLLVGCSHTPILPSISPSCQDTDEHAHRPGVFFKPPGPGFEPPFAMIDLSPLTAKHQGQFPGQNLDTIFYLQLQLPQIMSCEPNVLREVSGLEAGIFSYGIVSQSVMFYHCTTYCPEWKFF